MLKILALIDASNNAGRVIYYLIRAAADMNTVGVSLINVREPVNAPEVRRFWRPIQMRDFQQKDGNLLLQPAREKLAAAGVRASTQVLVGDIAPTIVALATPQLCDMIVRGGHGMNAIANLLLGSVATKLHLSKVLVTLIK